MDNCEDKRKDAVERLAKLRMIMEWSVLNRSIVWDSRAYGDFHPRACIAAEMIEEGYSLHMVADVMQKAWTSVRTMAELIKSAGEYPAMYPGVYPMYRQFKRKVHEIDERTD